MLKHTLVRYSGSSVAGLVLDDTEARCDVALQDTEPFQYKRPNQVSILIAEGAADTVSSSPWDG